MAPIPAGGAAVRAGSLYFVLVFAAGFALGILRTLVLEPAFGSTLAVVLELPWILAWSWWVCRRLVARLDVAATVLARGLMGGLAFALLLAAESGLGAVLGESPREQLGSYGEAPGLLGLVGQVAFALFPLAQLPRTGQV